MIVLNDNELPAPIGFSGTGHITNSVLIGLTYLQEDDNPLAITPLSEFTLRFVVELR